MLHSNGLGTIQRSHSFLFVAYSALALSHLNHARLVRVLPSFDRVSFCKKHVGILTSWNKLGNVERGSNNGVDEDVAQEDEGPGLSLSVPHLKTTRSILKPYSH